MAGASDLTVADFRDRFDEFTVADYPDRQVGFSLTEAKRLSIVSPEAALYCTAHLLTLWKNESRDEGGNPAIDGGSGVVVSETIGPRSVAYATPSGRKFYERTYYGRMFLELSNASPRRNLPMFIR